MEKVNSKEILWPTPVKTKYIIQTITIFICLIFKICWVTLVLIVNMESIKYGKPSLLISKTFPRYKMMVISMLNMRRLRRHLEYNWEKSLQFKQVVQVFAVSIYNMFKRTIINSYTMQYNCLPSISNLSRILIRSWTLRLT